MNDKSSAQEKFSQLRKQAESMLINNDIASMPPVEDDPRKLIQELQTFQTELELQNEELQRSQQELMEIQIKYTQLYDFAPVGYLTIEAGGMIREANLMLADMLSVERSTLIGQSFSVHITSEDQDIYYQHIRGLCDENKRQVCELRIKKKEAAAFYVQLESTPLPDRIGKPERYQTVVIDINDRKQMEKEQENLQQQLFQAHKLTAIATMAGGIAHDFNNILYIILGNVELLMEDIPEWQPSYASLDIIKKTALRAADIVKILRDFSCKTEQDQKSIVVAEAINQNYKLLRSLIPSTINIRMDVPDSDIMIMANPAQFNQVLINLSTNAAQSMVNNKGIIDIKLETQFLKKGAVDHYPGLIEGNYAKISICDNGPGIPPEIINQIFDPYFTTRDFGEGSGMGLAVVHGIVNNHNGAITVAGQPGQGACFTIFFPVIGQKPAIKTEPPYEEVYGNESILYVDDESDILMVAEEIFKMFGYRIEVMSDPKEALALFKLDPDYFDVVVTDMTMPAMTGIELTRELRAVHSDIPIIVCTGNSSLIDERKASQLKISGCIEKPLSIPYLVKTIRHILYTRHEPKDSGIKYTNIKNR